MVMAPEITLPHTFRYGLDPDEHEDYVQGVCRVQVAAPEVPANGVPNPNKSPVYALFTAGSLEVRVNDDDDWEARVGRPYLENGIMTKRELVGSLDRIADIRAYQLANPDPDRSIGGMVKQVAAAEVTQMVTGSVLDELEALRAYKRQSEESRSFVPPPAAPAEPAPTMGKTLEQLMAEARPARQMEAIASALHPGEKRCPVADCGWWGKMLSSHLRFMVLHGKKNPALVELHKVALVEYQAAKKAG